MSLRLAPILASAGLDLLATTAAAQRVAASSTALRPLGLGSIAAALARPVGQPVPAARTVGQLDLKGQRLYIAEYLLLWDVPGTVPATARDGHLLGMAVSKVSTMLADRAWTDLQARLATAGVVLADAASVVREYGAVYAATEPASAPGAPVLLQAQVGGTTRRYLLLAPTGIQLVRRDATGVGPGNPAARQAYTLHGIEAVSLAIAINLGVHDGSGQRPPGFDAPGGQPSLSELEERALRAGIHAAATPGVPAANVPVAFDRRRVRGDVSIAHRRMEADRKNFTARLCTKRCLGRMRPATSSVKPSADLCSVPCRTVTGVRVCDPTNRLRLQSLNEASLG